MSLRTRFSRTVAAALGIVLAAASHAADVDLTQPVPKVANRTAVALGGTPTQVVEFTNWKSALLVNDVFGRLQRGVFCSDDVTLRYSKKFDDWMSTGLAHAFRERAAALGFTAADDSKSVFDSRGGNAADYRLGATLLAFDYRTCGREEVKGDAYTKIKWEVFSARRQQVVYTTIVEAGFSAPGNITSKSFERGMMNAVVENFLADPKLAEVIRSGSVLDATAAKALAPLQLDPGPVVAGGVSKAADGLLGAVVTVESGVGSGSAFYISRDGYLLTNQHVVADAKFVRIKLAGGRSLVGEVLRVDPQRDVALLRTDPVPNGVLALRHDESRVGEEVYALGSPFGAVLSGTLTRGVLSARRVLEGVAYLQSDVAINPGNSGGPLVDAEGRVLGIAQLGSGGRAQGISLFIPIDDALDKLSLSLAPR